MGILFDHRASLLESVRASCKLHMLSCRDKHTRGTSVQSDGTFEAISYLVARCALYGARRLRNGVTGHVDGVRKWVSPCHVRGLTRRRISVPGVLPSRWKLSMKSSRLDCTVVLGAIHRTKGHFLPRLRAWQVMKADDCTAISLDR